MQGNFYMLPHGLSTGNHAPCKKMFRVSHRAPLARDGGSDQFELLGTSCPQTRPNPTLGPSLSRPDAPGCRQEHVLPGHRCQRRTRRACRRAQEFSPAWGRSSRSISLLWPFWRTFPRRGAAPHRAASHFQAEPLSDRGDIHSCDDFRNFFPCISE